ncbi:polyhydroxyalkanoate depolymerase, partial [Mycobacterium tuberculosis]
MNEYGYYAATPMRAAARSARDFWRSPLNPAANTALGRTLYAATDLFSNVTRRYGKPEWGIDKTVVNGVEVRVRQTTVWQSPWCKLIQFDRDMGDMRRAGRLEYDPAVLIVAPLSGHYATL